MFTVLNAVETCKNKIAEGIEYLLCVLVDLLFPRTINWPATIPFRKVSLIIISTSHQGLLSVVIPGKVIRLEGLGTMILRSNCIPESQRINLQVPRKQQEAKSFRHRAQPVQMRSLLRGSWSKAAMTCYTVHTTFSRPNGGTHIPHSPCPIQTPKG